MNLPTIVSTIAATVDEINSPGGRDETVKTDVSNEQSVAQMQKQL